MFLVLGEVLGAHVLDLFEFLIVLLVNAIVVGVYLHRLRSHEVLQTFHLVRQSLIYLQIQILQINFELLVHFAEFCDVKFEVVRHGLVNCVDVGLDLVLHVRHVLLYLKQVGSDGFFLLLNFPESVFFKQCCFFVLLGVVVQYFIQSFYFLSNVCELVFKALHGQYELIIELVVLVI